MTGARQSIEKAAFEDFLIHEARLLDDRNFRAWMELFTEDGTYWVPAVPGQNSPFDQASLFYDDRELMRTRIDRLEHPRIHVQTPPSRTAHIIGNITVAKSDDGTDFEVTSTVFVAEYRQDKQRLFAGRQHHKLRVQGEDFRIAHKKVELINCDSAFEALAVPI